MKKKKKLKINRQERTTHTKVQKHDDSETMILTMNHYLRNGQTGDQETI